MLRWHDLGLRSRWKQSIQVATYSPSPCSRSTELDPAPDAFCECAAQTRSAPPNCPAGQQHARLAVSPLLAMDSSETLFITHHVVGPENEKKRVETLDEHHAHGGSGNGEVSNRGKEGRYGCSCNQKWSDRRAGESE